MKEKQKSFFQIKEDQDRKKIWNGKPIEKSVDSRVKIKCKNFNKIPNLQNVFRDTTGKSLKKLGKMENLTYKKLLKNLIYEMYKAKSGENNSEKFKYTKNNLKPNNLQREGVKIIIPSNIIDIYTRLQILLGLKVSGHTDTLTEASNLNDDLYKRGEVQNEQHYRNIPNKFSK